MNEPKTKYFLDCEFIEDGKTIDLLSLALVCEDGRELYKVNSNADHSMASPWVKENVLPQLMTHPDPRGDMGAHALDKVRMAEHVLGFIKAGPANQKPEFWGYYADYDWVAFCQLFGTMMDLPKGFPMYCRDLKQWCDMIGNPRLPDNEKGEHHALLDARWNLKAYKFLVQATGFKP